VVVCARRYGIPVWMTHGTWLAAGCPELPALHLFGGHDGRFAIGDLEVEPFSVPHDAREPVQYVLQARQRRLGVLTDIGSLTPHVLECLAGVDGLLLECNHDADMLANGPYPPSLRARVGGDFGHLSNRQAASVLQQIDAARLAHLVAGHISQKNNAPALVRAVLSAAAPWLGERLALLVQDEVSGWFVL
jgi:phosphoribosyl 1,2-cyclic phosphodiesterase